MMHVIRGELAGSMALHREPSSAGGLRFSYAVTSRRVTRARVTAAATPASMAAVGRARPIPSSAVPPWMRDQSTWPGNAIAGLQDSAVILDRARPGEPDAQCELHRAEDDGERCAEDRPAGYAAHHSGVVEQARADAVEGEPVGGRNVICRADDERDDEGAGLGVGDSHGGRKEHPGQFADDHSWPVRVA